MTEVEIVVVRVRFTRIEIQAVGGRARRVLRGRPVVAVRTGIVEAGGIAVARCWQEDAATIDITGELATFHTVHRSPFVSAVAYQFILLRT